MMASAQEISRLCTTENNTRTHPEYPVCIYWAQVIGWINIVFGSAAAIVTSLCMASICRSRDLFEKASYKLIFAASCFDLFLQVEGVIYPGIMMASYQNGPEVLMTTAAGMGNGAWRTYSSLIVVLSINRAIILWKTEWSKALFDNQKVWIWVAAFSVYGLAICITIIARPDEYKTVYAIDKYCWYWLGNMTPDVEAFVYLRRIHDNTTMAVTCAAYVITMLGMLKQRSMAAHKKLSKVEMRALFAGFGISFSFMVAMIWWNINFYMDSDFTLAVSQNIFTVLFYGSNGYIYMVFNGSIRHGVSEMLGLAKPVRVIASGTSNPSEIPGAAAAVKQEEDLKMVEKGLAGAELRNGHA